MTPTYTIEKDGSLTIMAVGDTSRNIEPAQIALYRRDPAFEAALQAAAGQPGNLTAAQLQALPVAS